MSKRFPTRKLVKVADAYRHGATYAEINKKFGAGDGTIRRACKEFGVKLRGRGNHTTAPTAAPPVVDTINKALQTDASAASPPTLFSITGPVLELITQAQQERRISHVAIQETSAASIEVRFLINRGKI